MNEIIVNILPRNLRAYLGFKGNDNMTGICDYKSVEEIRLRVGRPAIIFLGSRMGELQTDYIVSVADLQEAMEYITGFSLYAYESELKEGFITIKGGHRVGVAGKVVKIDNRITTISPISSINIRVSHEVNGCADSVMPYIVGKDKFWNTLIVSAPGGGKTTLLRDIVRQLSDIHKLKVSIVDERSEIASCYKGIPQCDVGIRSDIYDCCHKAEGMMLMIRAMSPQVVAVDELGDDSDKNAIADAMRCGCKILATAHGETIDDIMYKGYDFDRYIVLTNGVERKAEVYDGQLNRII